MNKANKTNKVNKEAAEEVEIKSVAIKVNRANKGIGKFICASILSMGQSEEGLDRKKLDDICFKKFGLTKKGGESRLTSIEWHLNKMKKAGVIKVG